MANWLFDPEPLGRLARQLQDAYTRCTWAEPNRIETVARQQFGMVTPGQAETVVIKAGAP